MAGGPITEVRGETKSCSMCGEFKPFSEFYREKGGRMGLSSKCKPCMKIYAKSFPKSPERLERDRANRARYREANPEACRNARLKNLFGITLEDYNRMLEEQGGCAICGAAEASDGRRLHVDHDHDTGRVRGLLCNHCNRGVAAFMDDPALLVSAIEYLQ